MLEKVVFITKDNQYQLPKVEIKNHKYEIDLSWIEKSNATSFDIEFVFQNPIQKFRNHDYTWVDCKKDRTATEFSPKIIKLSNEILVQANVNHGIWEVKKKLPNSLFWRFNPENAHPVVNYVGDKNEKKIISADVKIDFKTKLELLFPKQAIEISRSRIPFSAIACFTDHCDFDTLENLKTQRAFFKEQQIKVTKGFFLNHFSKREDNASFERNSEELNKWREDGHELCYHSLSQSIKSEEESFKDFENFQPPYSDIPTWIDHGYQPYNLTLYNNNNKTATYFSETIKKKGIQILWNYIDSGTSTKGVINQMNPEHFTLKSFLKGIKKESFISKVGHFFKAIIFHYYSDIKTVYYIDFTIAIKNIIYKKQIKSFIPLFSNGFKLFFPFLRTVLCWNSSKNQTFRNAKYTPLFFPVEIDNQTFTIFQTLEMIDFNASLSGENINNLIKEKGVFIAHTYFSAPMPYQKGRLLKNETEINPIVIEQIKLLSNAIKENKIWNPSLKELVEYLSKLEKVKYDIDENQSILINSEIALNNRIIS